MQDNIMKKYDKITRSKNKFPTHQVRGSRPGEGYIKPGHVSAKQNIEQQLGISISHLKTSHTKYLWRWCVPVSSGRLKKRIEGAKT